MLSMGTFVYNEIITVPFFGFDQWTAKAIAERKGDKDTTDINYVSLSPAKGYNQRDRNLRGLETDGKTR